VLCAAGIGHAAWEQVSLEDAAAAAERMGYPLVAKLVSRDVLHKTEVGGVIIEALVGVTTDPVFGPLLVCGLGGVLVELLRDVSFRLTPVSDLDAREMVGSLRAAKLLDGHRGSPPGDREGLIDAIERVSALVEVVPEIRELDLNPVKVLEPGKGAIVVDARIRVAPV
jgi:acyl-CoA synthetase (NDP forming)